MRKLSRDEMIKEILRAFKELLPEDQEVILEDVRRIVLTGSSEE